MTDFAASFQGFSTFVNEGRSVGLTIDKLRAAYEIMERYCRPRGPSDVLMMRDVWPQIKALLPKLDTAEATPLIDPPDMLQGMRVHVFDSWTDLVKRYRELASEGKYPIIATTQN